MNWTQEKNTLTKNFGFKDFVSAIDFVNKIAKEAEALNHHPDILIHGYKNVKITLSTHDQDKVTKKDFELAKRIDKLITI